MISHTKLGHFESAGTAYNLVLGAVPDHIRVINANAADTEVYECEWFKEFGDSKDIWKYMVNNDGGDDIDTPVKKSSGGYIAAYDTEHVGEYKSCTFDYTGGASEDLVTCTHAEGHGFSNGERVKFVLGGTIPTGLSALTVYYVISATALTFQLSLTKGGTAVAMTSDGVAPNYMYSLDNLKMEGGKGVTIAADFMADGDEIYYIATFTDWDKDHGDVA